MICVIVVTLGEGRTDLKVIIIVQSNTLADMCAMNWNIPDARSDESL